MCLIISLKINWKTLLCESLVVFLNAVFGSLASIGFIVGMEIESMACECYQRVMLF
jgi:hypothetical protein